MLVSDLRHFLELPDGAAGPARRLAEHLRFVVQAATAGEAGVRWVSALPCRRRPGNRRCAGRMIVQRADAAEPIAWGCSSCGDAGLISGWEDSPADMRGRQPKSTSGVHQLRIPDEVATTLRDITLLDADCERVVFRARAHGDDVILSASDDELDELIGYVAAEANHEPNRRRQRRLDVAFAVLGEAAPNPRRAPTIPGTFGGRSADAPPRSGPAQTGLPELGIAQVQRWCAARVPEHPRHQVRLECEVATRHLTILERRAPWRADFGPEWTSSPIARLRYAKTTKTWTLYWRDRNLRFHTYDRLPASRHIEGLLTEIDRYPTGIFWG